MQVITETVVHTGHLDAARELLDGRTWLGLEDTRIPRLNERRPVPETPERKAAAWRTGKGRSAR